MIKLIPDLGVVGYSQRIGEVVGLRAEILAAMLARISVRRRARAKGKSGRVFSLVYFQGIHEGEMLPRGLSALQQTVHEGAFTFVALKKPSAELDMAQDCRQNQHIPGWNCIKN